MATPNEDIQSIFSALGVNDVPAALNKISALAQKPPAQRFAAASHLNLPAPPTQKGQLDWIFEAVGGTDFATARAAIQEFAELESNLNAARLTLGLPATAPFSEVIAKISNFEQRMYKPKL